MAQPFVLKLTDNLETVNFLADPYYVMDGGFDISLPRVKRELAVQRPGFYVPMVANIEYREARLKFEIRGATRSSVISSLNKIERIIRNIDARTRISAGRRGELSYAWSGATSITYFEIYGGQVAFPSDVFSVAKIHLLANGQYALPDVELTLYLSGMGYGVSIYSDSLTEVPLYNPTVGSKITGGVVVQNPGNGQYHWVEIDGSDLPGSQPLITKVVLISDSPYSAWKMLYMGLQASPFPSKLVFDDSEVAWSQGGSTVPSGSANGGQYRTITFAGSNPIYNFFSTWAWSVSNSTVGMFFAFYHGFDAVSDNWHLAIGIDDYVSYGIRYQEDYVANEFSSARGVPLGAIQLPPTGLELANYGTINPDLWMGLWVAGETGGTLSLDYLSLLPIGGGMRMWKSRVSNLTGTMVDDGWRGVEYLKDASNRVANPFYGLMEPLKLEPGIDQRLYFTTLGQEAPSSERQRKMRVQVYVVPTYSTLAM